MKRKLFAGLGAAAILALALGFAGCPSGGQGEPRLYGEVFLVGEAVVGRTLTADTAALSGSGEDSFRWFRGETVIAGAAGASYQVATVDLGHRIRVAVSRTGSSGEVESAPSDPVTAGETPITAVRVIADEDDPGMAGAGAGGQMNFFITIDAEGDGAEDVFPLDLQGGNVSVEFSTGGAVPGISIMPGTVESAGVPSRMSLSVNRGTLANLSLRILVSGVGSGAFPLNVGSAPALTGAVRLAGMPTVGGELEADLSYLDGTTLPAFRWQRGTHETGFADIPDATGPTHALASEDEGMTLRVAVRRAGFQNTVYSSASLTVTGEGPALGGTVTIAPEGGVPFDLGVTLAADTSGLTPAGDGGLSFQWQRRPAHVSDGMPFDSIPGATGGTHLLAQDDFNHVIRVAVMRSGYSGFVASAPTAPVPGQPITIRITDIPDRYNGWSVNLILLANTWTGRGLESVRVTPVPGASVDFLMTHIGDMDIILQFSATPMGAVTGQYRLSSLTPINMGVNPISWEGFT